MASTPSFNGLRAEVATASCLLADTGLVIGTAGNVSARTGDHVAVTATGIALGDATREQVSVVDLDGNVVAGELLSTSELAIHLGIYRRYDAGAVVHTHSPLATALSTVAPFG